MDTSPQRRNRDLALSNHGDPRKQKPHGFFPSGRLLVIRTCECCKAWESGCLRAHSGGGPLTPETLSGLDDSCARRHTSLSPRGGEGASPGGGATGLLLGTSGLGDSFLVLPTRVSQGCFYGNRQRPRGSHRPLSAPDRVHLPCWPARGREEAEPAAAAEEEDTDLGQSSRLPTTHPHATRQRPSLR